MANVNDTTFLTPAASELFLAYAKDAPNWDGMPLLGGNVEQGPRENGLLTNLKKAGLVATEEDWDDPSLVWLHFTDLGKAYAAEHGFPLD